MPVWSEVQFDNMFEGIDIAAEHYHPAKLKWLSRLEAKGGDTINHIAELIRQIVTPNPDIPVFDLSAAQKHFLQKDDSQTEARVSVKKVAQSGDIIISRLRSYLKQVAFIPNTLGQIHLSTEFIILRGKTESDIRFLLPYLLSKPIQTILQWSQDGNEHPRFNEKMLLNLHVDPAVRSIAKTLGQFVDKAANSLSDSKHLYAQAEDMLLSELGLGDLDLSSTLFYEHPFWETQQATRLDAEYFSPRVQKIIANLSEDDLTISDVAKLAKRHFKPKPGVPFHYIEIADIGTSGNADSKEVAGEEAPSRATWIVRPGDVLTSTVRPIRRLSAIVSENQMDFVCSSGFAVLRPQGIEPELLLVYLRLPIVAELLDLHTTASMYPAISTGNLLGIPFKMPRGNIQEEVVSMIRKSFKARDKSHNLLEEAKRLVEIAILGENR